LAQRVVYRAHALYREQREVQFDVAKRRRGWGRRKRAGSNTRGGWFLKIKEAHLKREALFFFFIAFSLSLFLFDAFIIREKNGNGEGARFGD
jgi:hypothetical protein